MKIAIIGSRSLHPDLTGYIPDNCTEIISGGAKGVDSCAADYAAANGIKLTEFKPDYRRYGRGATHRRNDLIIAAADIVICFWDGKSRGTKSIMEKTRKANKPALVWRI